MPARTFFLVLSALTAIAASALVYAAIIDKAASIPTTVLLGSAGSLFAITSLCCLDIARKITKDFYPIQNTCMHYLIIRIIPLIAWIMRKRIENDSKNVKTVQEENMLRIIRNNKDTVYGREHGFSDIKSRHDFIEKQPLTSYTDFEPYIDRMMEGEKNVLIASPTIIFGITSGTTGKSKALPVTNHHLKTVVLNLVVVFDVIFKEFTKMSLQKVLRFAYFTSQPRETKTGIPIGPVTSSAIARSKHSFASCTTPFTATRILSEPEALYIHLLFALRDRTLGMIEANFASMIHTAFQTMERQQEQLLSDIETGTINPSLQIDKDVRQTLTNQLTADPARALKLREAFKDGSSGLVKRIWPECRVVCTVTSGSFSFYFESLKVYCKGIPIYSPMYMATEGPIGLNIWPHAKTTRYLLIPRALFCEFIPCDIWDESQPKTLFMDEVEIGHVYEVVVTNANGLYRFRFGDVVKVVDKYNKCPVVEFMYRKGQFLNVRGEKTSETSFYEALCATIEKWPDVTLVDYCCAESVMMDNTPELVPSVSDPETDHENICAPFYYVFLELDNKGKTSLSDDDKKLLDETLCAQSFVYMSFRKKGSIRPMSVQIVEPGTFLALREYSINSMTASSNQYKVPRALKKNETAEFMFKRMVQSS